MRTASVDHITMIMAMFSVVLLCLFCPAVANSATDNSSEMLEQLRRLERLYLTQQENFLETRKAWHDDLTVLKNQVHALNEKNALLETRLETRTLELKQENRNLQEQVEILQKSEAELKAECRELKASFLQLVESIKEISYPRGSHVPVTSNAADSDATSGLQEGKKDNSSSASSVVKNVSTRSDDPNALAVTVSQLSEKVIQMQADLQTVHNAAQLATGTTFVRWGSSSCPSTAQLLYPGWVGGGNTASVASSPPNQLCLPHNPVLLDRPLEYGHYTNVFGAEYEDENHHNLDPVCAVCWAGFATTVMLPGTNVCPSGWTRQYSGDLMASPEYHLTGAEFVCVDSSMEARPGSGGNNPGTELFFTSTVCGSLPCPPYVGGKTLTCVVCSK